MLETALILLLAILYQGKTLSAAVFALIYFGVCLVFFSDTLPMSILWWGQVLAAPTVIAGKVGHLAVTVHIHSSQILVWTAVEESFSSEAPKRWSDHPRNRMRDLDIERQHNHLPSIRYSRSLTS